MRARTRSRSGPPPGAGPGHPSTSRAGGGYATRRAAPLLLALLVLVGLVGCVTVSRQDEIEMGRDFSRQINEQLPLVDDPIILGPIDEEGHRLARLSPRPDLPYEFHLVNTNVINAFAVPGGFIYMNRGLVEASGDMSEVVGVLAHEVGHVVARHSAEQIERSRKMGLGLALGSVIFGAPSGLARLGVNVGANLYFAKHSRADEAEADSIGVALMSEAGWDPCGLVDFFRTLLAEREDRPGALASLFASHPLTESRIRETDRMITRLPAERREGLRTSSAEYRRMVRALRDFPPPPPKFRVDEEKAPEGEEPGAGEEPDGPLPDDGVRACPVDG